MLFANSKEIIHALLQSFGIVFIYHTAQKHSHSLESNEIMELDDYPVGLLLEDLSHYLIFGVRIPKACV